MNHWHYRQDTDCYACSRSGAVVTLGRQFYPKCPTDADLDAYIDRALEFWTFSPDTSCWERLDGEILDALHLLANPTPMLYLSDHYLDYLLAKGPIVPVKVEQIAAAADKLAQTLYDMELARQSLAGARDRKRALLHAAERDGESDIRAARQIWDDTNEMWIEVRAEYFDLVNKKAQEPS